MIIQFHLPSVRTLLKFFPLGLLVAASALGAADEGVVDRPNFVFFIADDVSQADFGCYGHPTMQTPQIDALAQSGL